MRALSKHLAFGTLTKVPCMAKACTSPKAPLRQGFRGGWAGETHRKQVWSCRELQYSTVHALRKDFGNAEAIELERICTCSQILLSIIPWNAFVYFGLLLFPSAFGLLLTHSHGMGLTDGSPAVS